MESIEELKTICQTTAKKDISNIYMRYICRAISIHITRLLIPTSVTADQVSAAMIVVGVVASLFFLCVSPFFFITGILLLQLWYVLDCVDGEVARYRNYHKDQQVTDDKMDLPITGAYWDYLNHYIVHGLVPFTVGFGVFRATGNSFWILVGFLASLGQTLLLAIHDTKSRLFLGKINRVAQSAFSITCKAQPAGEKKIAKVKQWSFGKWIFVIFHYTTTYPTVMNVLTVLGFISLFAVPLAARITFIIYYAVASLVVFLGLARNNLWHSALDREFDETYAVTLNKQIKDPAA